jgi:hypothetical protein
VSFSELSFPAPPPRNPPPPYLLLLKWTTLIIIWTSAFLKLFLKADYQSGPVRCHYCPSSTLPWRPRDRLCHPTHAQTSVLPAASSSQPARLEDLWAWRRGQPLSRHVSQEVLPALTLPRAGLGLRRGCSMYIGVF